jgi:homoserine kinase type II
MNFPGQQRYAMMPHVVIHGDYHPGNLKFHDGKVVGVFDFDWAKIDTRCFDVALAVNYFCMSWEGSKDGELLLDRVRIFLNAYQQALKDLNGLSGLHDLELLCFPEMLMMSNVSTIDWMVKTFYTTTPDPDEYQTYLRHNVRLMQSLERDRERLSECMLTYRC